MPNRFGKSTHPPKHFQPAYLGSAEFASNGYHCEELRDGFYWVTSGGYDAAFMVTEEGVIAIDAPPILGENMLAAIEAVTDKPVAKVIYSHWHSDHIGAASMYGTDVEIIAHEITHELLARFPDPLRPLPTRTFKDELAAGIKHPTYLYSRGSVLMNALLRCRSEAHRERSTSYVLGSKTSVNRTTSAAALGNRSAFLCMLDVTT